MGTRAILTFHWRNGSETERLCKDDAPILFVPGIIFNATFDACQHTCIISLISIVLIRHKNTKENDNVRQKYKKESNIHSRKLMQTYIFYLFIFYLFHFR